MGRCAPDEPGADRERDINVGSQCCLMELKTETDNRQAGAAELDKCRIECYRPVSLEDKEFFDEVFRINQPEASELTFIYLFIWKADYRFSWTVHDGMLLIVSQSRIDIPFALQPLPIDGHMTVQRLENAVRFLGHTFAFAGKRLVFSRMDVAVLEWFRQIRNVDFTVEQSPNTSDYVYDGNDLRTLAGKRYSAKRNHISQFRRAWPEAELVPITSAHAADCMEIFNRWCAANDCDCDQPENCEKYAFRMLMDNWDRLNANGVLIRVNGRYEAFTVGESLNGDTVVIRFEKGNSEVHGIYTYLGQAYLNTSWPDVKWVNREEDMGIEGLRRSKQSLYPARMLEKVTVFF